MEDNVVIDLTINEKQKQFFYEIFKTTTGNSKYRKLFYGGAVRSGKTAVCLTAFILLAKKYPNSRWHIIRDTFATLEQTTIPSFEKFCPENSQSVLRYSRNKSNYFVEFTNGSKIFFADENYDRDHDLTWMLGLETNGILLEQIEGLTRNVWMKALERVGSWYIDPMPPGLILSTFNPCHNWVKKEFYEPYVKGELADDFFFLEALPTDNPLITDDQWNAWKMLDPVNYAQFIKGDWDAIEVSNAFMTQYDIKKHESGKASFDPMKQLFMSIDFNINPFCIVFFHKWRDAEGDHLHIFDEIAIKQGSIPQMVTQIKTRYGAYLPNARLTGDSMGKRREIGEKDNASYYLQLQRGLGLRDSQLMLPANPSHENSRADCNYVLYHYPDFKINNTTCPDTCRDMKIVQCDSAGKIMKSNRKDVSQQADYFDCVRYAINTFLFDWLKQHSRKFKLVS